MSGLGHAAIDPVGNDPVNQYLPDDELRDKGKPKPPSMNRIAIWLVVGGIGVYFLASGIIGIVTGGGN